MGQFKEIYNDTHVSSISWLLARQPLNISCSEFDVILILWQMFMYILHISQR